jgi:hypothetical protein
MNRRTLILLPLLALPLVGFGCAKKPPAAPPPATQPGGYEPLAYLPPDPPPEDDKAKNLRELRDAVAAFQSVKTFRAKLYVDAPDGKTTGQIDVMKPDRFHGTVDVPDGSQQNEVIGIGTAMYLKQADGTWIQVQSAQLSSELGAAFRSAVDTDNGLVSVKIPDSSDISKSRNQIRNCDEYRTSVSGDDGKPVQLTICVDKGLPKIVEATADAGYVSIEYFDYNKLFVIERPTVKKL